MEAISKIVPITVIVAVSIFIIKEVLEFMRRRRADRRKITALKTLLATECEKNHWVMKSLGRASANIDDQLDLDDDADIRASVNSRSWIAFKYTHSSGSWGSVSVPPVQRTQLDKYMLEAALLDKDLFEAVQVAYDAALELDHIRTGLFDAVTARNQNEDMLLESFDVYAKTAITECYDGTNVLYKVCTGRDMVEHRVI